MMLNEIIQSLLKDRNLMESFLQGKVQFAGISELENKALFDVMGSKQPAENVYGATNVWK
ncbi:competence pheromone ComX [Paenibacillus sp. SC116]|uniref:competence pheromone ComX n=1 Tax=Paenibacillus sp. SC116 TaxID=2968986 RepID=UPI00215AAE52|nr:competence pheromone ComX [Paenibacillus sp. SC116]MCR8846323.1 competence pheromone ComX [Paenibacillus sp. SC116]